MELMIEREKTKTGLDTLKVNGYYIHSKYDPEKEATRIARSNYKPHYVHVLYGYGLGYVAEALIQAFQFNETFIIIDPLLDDAEDTVQLNYEQAYFVSSQNVDLLKELFEQHLVYSSKVHFISLSNYEHLFPENLKLILKVIRDGQYKQIYNVNTIIQFALEWKINLLLNLPNVETDGTIEALHKKYDAPVVIASGGPSLIKQLELLKKYRNNVILICAGSTINSLLKYDIMPNYVVTIDGSMNNYLHFKDLQLSKCSIIYSPLSHYKIRNHFHSYGYTMLPDTTAESKEYILTKVGKNLPTLLGGGSVAHFAFSVAKYITSGPIAFIGQDLAFTNNETHADGNKNKRHANHSDIEQHVMVEGYYGESVLSSTAFRAMIETFEELQYYHPYDNKVFNCTEGGANLKNYENIPFVQYLETYCQHIAIQHDIRNVSSIPTFAAKFIEEEIEVCKKIVNTLDLGLNLIGSVKTDYLLEKHKTNLIAIEREFKQLYKSIVLEILLDPITMACAEKYLPKVNETIIEEHQRTKAYILELYKNSKEAVEMYIEYLNTMKIKNYWDIK